MLEIIQDKKTKTAIVCPFVLDEHKKITSEDVDSRMEEINGLVLAMGQAIVLSEAIKLKSVVPATLLGQGSIGRLRELYKIHEIELLVIDRPISAIQQRNLEKKLDVKVIDRTAVILEIFGARARTAEGKLQVELAHLTYQRGRLVRSWTHLERQRGGGGFLGGPGETQIELDKRHLDERIIKLKKELDKVKKTRAIQRSARIKVPYPTAALVGYTNAGKSTLFNAITQSDVFAKDMLFATLDPTLRKINLPSGKEIILSDTVGFIANLPHELVMAFRATLEEVLESQVIVHVIDVSNPFYKEQRNEVLEVLHELGLKKIEYENNYIEVYNKIDLLEGGCVERYRGKNNAVFVSSVNKTGIDDLLHTLEGKIRNSKQVKIINVDIRDGKKLALVYQKYEVLDRTDFEDKVIFKVLE